MRRLALALALTTATIATAPDTAQAAPRFCNNVADEATAQDRPDLAYPLGRIAYRESRCQPRHVRDRDDLSYSRLGLNFKTRGLRRFWQQTCGVTHYSQTADLTTDVACAIAAWDRLGVRPWRRVP